MNCVAPMMYLSISLSFVSEKATLFIEKKNKRTKDEYPNKKMKHVTKYSFSKVEIK